MLSMHMRKPNDPDTPTFLGGFVILAKLVLGWGRRLGKGVHRTAARFEMPYLAAWFDDSKSPPKEGDPPVDMGDWLTRDLPLRRDDADRDRDSDAR